MVKGNIASCLTNKETFTQFVSQCLSEQDIARTSTVISGQDLKNIFTLFFLYSLTRLMISVSVKELLPFKGSVKIDVRAGPN